MAQGRTYENYVLKNESNPETGSAYYGRRSKKSIRSALPGKEIFKKIRKYDKKLRKHCWFTLGKITYRK